MIDIQRSNDVLARTDHEANGGEMKRHALAETLAADPQLSIGLLVLQSKLIGEGAVLDLEPVQSEAALAESAQDNTP